MAICDIIMNGSVAGLQIRETELATEAAEDWSQCRSPSRARRREKLGYPQRVKRWRKPACYQMGGLLVIHPALMRELNRRLANNVDEAMFRALTSSPPPRSDGEP